MTQLCIKAAVNDEKAHEFVQRFMLSLLLHIKGEVNNAQGLADVESACASISAHSAIILDKTAANGCQSVRIDQAQQSSPTKSSTQAYLDCCRQTVRREKLVSRRQVVPPERTPGVPGTFFVFQR